MAILYPVVISVVVSDSKVAEYFSTPKTAIVSTVQKMISLPIVDIVILSSGLLGTIVSGIVIKMLRKNGYQMF